MLLSDTQRFAAVDIGSNSIHLAIAERHGNQLKRVASMSEKVQLAMGLNAQNYLTPAVMERGFECLQRFVGRLGDVNSSHLRVVATNTLRRATNSQDFIAYANGILPVPIEIISGREEARLIYLGVAHTCPSSKQQLVVDIGGGSTELIIGKNLTPLLTESTQIGAVSFSQQFFGDGTISAMAFEKAIYAAQKELIKFANLYKKTGFDDVLGSSGTIKTIGQALTGFGLANEITLAGVEQLKASLIACAHVNEIDMQGVKAHRKAIFPAGVAILLAIMKVFGIRLLRYCDGALREGVMYDMLSRIDFHDVRDDSVLALIDRFGVDKKQAKRVAKTAVQLFTQAQSTLSLSTESEQMLKRAALLHEIGLAIGHSGYHKHGSYLLKHADMAGFSRTDQEKLALLVRYHRRAITTDDHERVIKIGGMALAHLSLLMRLSVVANYGRFELAKQQLKLDINNSHWHVSVKVARPEHQACVINIQDETHWFAKWGIELSVASV